MATEQEMFLQDPSYWKLKLQENLSTRRGTMYRFLSSSLQLLLLGNAGGIGFIFGMFRTGSGVNEPTWVHWSCTFGILAYMLGCLASATTVIYANALAIKEAHAAETALKLVIENKMSKDEAVLYLDESTFSMASVAMVSGVASLIFLLLGSILAMIILVLYY